MLSAWRLKEGRHSSILTFAAVFGAELGFEIPPDFSYGYPELREAWTTVVTEIRER